MEKELGNQFSSRRNWHARKPRLLIISSMPRFALDMKDRSVTKNGISGCAYVCAMYVHVACACVSVFAWTRVYVNACCCWIWCPRCQRCKSCNKVVAKVLIVTSMITMNNGDNRYCYLVTFNVYQCRAKKNMSGWAPRCCGYTYSFLATRMTITTRYYS